MLRKVFFPAFALAIMTLVVGSITYLLSEKRNNYLQEQYKLDPVALYKTVGIVDCESEHRYKGTKTGAVELTPEDRIMTLKTLENEFPFALTALYVNLPEAKSGYRGRPALLVLSMFPEIMDGRPSTLKDKYCILGAVGSYDDQFFLELEKKYQHKI